MVENASKSFFSFLTIVVAFCPAALVFPPLPFWTLSHHHMYMQGYQSPPYFPKNTLAGKGNSSSTESLCSQCDIAFQNIRFWKIKWKTEENQAFDPNEVPNVSHMDFIIFFGTSFHVLCESQILTERLLYQRKSTKKGPACFTSFQEAKIITNICVKYFQSENCCITGYLIITNKQTKKE